MISRESKNLQDQQEDAVNRRFRDIYWSLLCGIRCSIKCCLLLNDKKFVAVTELILLSSGNIIVLEGSAFAHLDSL